MFAVSLGVAAALCWSAHDCVARLYAERLGPFRMAFWVALAGAAILLPAVMWRGMIWQAEMASLGYALALGVVYAVALAGLFQAFSLAPVSIVGPTTAGYPALVVVWGLINGLAPTGQDWMGLVLVLAGAVIVGACGQRAGESVAVAPGKLVLALLAILAANLGFAASVVLGQKAALQLGEIETTFISRFPAALLLLPLFLRDLRSVGERAQGRAVTAVFAMALLDVCAVTVINYAGQFPNKEFAAMGISAYGALAVLLAMVFLNEKVARGQWLGIALVVGGIATLGWPKD